ncbi:MAG: hypothetical protein ABSC19_06300 [Syntrophorhabdales bacterium]
MSSPDIQGVKRVKQTLEFRGFKVDLARPQRVTAKAPQFHLKLSLGKIEGLRSAAKTAVTGLCVLYGNEMARNKVEEDLLHAIHDGDPNIALFAGWDYANEWPRSQSCKPHRSTPNARLSGFEHSLTIGDVEDMCVAYVEFFGGILFSVRPGKKSGVPPKGMAVNPRAVKPERFIVIPEMPQHYCPRRQDSLAKEKDKAMTTPPQAAGYQKTSQAAALSPQGAGNTTRRD